jgi:hypothetical protein
VEGWKLALLYPHPCLSSEVVSLEYSHLVLLVLFWSNLSFLLRKKKKKRKRKERKKRVVLAGVAHSCNPSYL